MYRGSKLDASLTHRENTKKPVFSSQRHLHYDSRNRMSTTPAARATRKKSCNSCTRATATVYTITRASSRASATISACSVTCYCNISSSARAVGVHKCLTEVCCFKLPGNNLGKFSGNIWEILLLIENASKSGHQR